ncbi:lysyl oxidase family protein [Stigmatella aurantiaca]|uniref:Lysyl oxidase n=1 Tax=Stigmatella aurantiaca (strain DW4/3-1) TaxID=378806 RepID=Q099W1_STIAD|nr:lysyl oxidase family protein [Stigmatella aurantiaca]ADO73076.1 Lysyl oxidase [Stigmatella aurantiaca DW4/3-1]EAU68521.1 hypothetical protein STIAU_7376 [Stigmatella aurantiaca DW4/3-1]
MRKALMFWAGLVLLMTGCDDDATYVAAGEVPGTALHVPPDGPGEVQLRMKNEGSATWKPDQVKLALREQQGWSGGPLVLTEQVKPGQVATFRGNITAPAQAGLHKLGWVPQRKGTAFEKAFETDVEVTCSNGEFCDGEERLANGRCVSGPPPCDDGAACTEDVCDPDKRTCQHIPIGSCAVCMATCNPDCSGKLCGEDGCGGQCGTCPAGQACAQGIFECRPDSQAGTCRNPLPLVADGTPLVGDHIIQGDTSNGFHQLIPSCNRTSTAVEAVYTFTTAEKLGLEARVSGYDTVLHLRKKRGADGTADCLDNTAARTVACSDDSSPPGDYGSRVSVSLDPGTYYLIVDGFDSTQAGPFTLSARFAANGCVPKCDGLYCGGSDGCGGNCGVCTGDESCVKGRCLPNPCIPNCDGKACGDNGCGGQCGFCPNDELCVPATGTCETFAACDHLRPSCTPSCGTSEFCGTDCACHPVSKQLPDLIVDEARLRDEILFDTIFVTENSCARVEECVEGTGERRVLRFSVEAVNQGSATLTVPAPAERPDLFTFSPCHGHYHFSGFATYALVDADGRTVLAGRKQAYCMEDTQRVATGPDVPCAKKFTCDDQGIQRGWSDLYGNTLDCQWLDITDVPPGDYRLQVTLNPSRAFQETTLDNNTSSVPVTLPAR